MSHSRTLNSKINRLQEWVLEISYSDHRSQFLEFLGKENWFSIHEGNEQTLVLEIDFSISSLRVSFNI